MNLRDEIHDIIHEGSEMHPGCVEGYNGCEDRIDRIVKLFEKRLKKMR